MKISNYRQDKTRCLDETTTNARRLKIVLHDMQVEPFYGTEYSCEALGDDLIKSWENCGRREELRLPEPNPVIATVICFV